MLIQMPAAVTGGEAVEMLIDGGPTGQQLPLFMKQLLGEACCAIEYAMLSHHDQDHVAGLAQLLKRPEVTIGSIFHNGLASWSPGIEPFDEITVASAAQAIFSDDNDDGQIDRVMGRLGSSGLRSDDLVADLAALRTAYEAGRLQGVYANWAKTIVEEPLPQPVSSFPRALRGSVLPVLTGQSSAGHRLHLDALWPLDPPREYSNSYGSWAYTINGNSVTMKLTYGDFEMLFTGDHNDASEEDWLDALGDEREELASDVLKIPHHGSGHSTPAFFKAVKPVVSVASMGSKGFGKSWKHPSEDVIKWAGGAHRVYHTYIHERPFKYAEFNDQLKQAMTETTNILIETDGLWFRVVELDDPQHIPPVTAVQRSNGTRWIRAADPD